jgi:2-polyprenyl-6-methoxyphenol hydroxylase-like FAD-dependent oxidoreductase
MNAEVTGLLREQERVAAVRYRRDGVGHDMIADLVVACDGRDSIVASSAT